ncbi:MAG TPA: alkaline phosphatase family protein [Candidatus Dormibacteraeota bacterium]|nr:alkaline phosphatase family protein [Candidatus Dormibacteraeota bacterium]
MLRRCAILAAFVVAGSAALAKSGGIVVPNGWVLAEPSGVMTETDTMPQGAAAASDGKTLAVVESGFNPPSLRLYSTADLSQTAQIPLRGAFGRPLWIDASHVLVAGANADALFDVDVASQTIQTIAMPKHSYPTAVAMAGDATFAAGTDGDGSVRIGTLDGIAKAKAVYVGPHVGGLAFSPSGKTLFASNRAGSSVEAVDVQSLAARRIAVGLHPSDVLPVGNAIYVAESDDDRVGRYDAASGRQLAALFVGDPSGARPLDGTSPNALARQGGTIFVSLGAANSVAVIRDQRVIGRIAAGWYPTDVVPIARRLFIVDGKGEGTRPNPNFPAQRSRSFYDYVAAIQYGSIRTYDLERLGTSAGNPQGARGWQTVPRDSVIRAGGPIKHVFFILKENRSYDQVLGDVPEGNGDAKLTWFGERVTPNQHALAARFGLFDNAYASGEVSESGHNWADAAFVNDYVERNWPPTYGDRGDVDDSLSGSGAAVPRNGYVWQAARAARVSFRDYGELTNVPNLTGPAQTAAPSLSGLYDPRYVGWNLDYSDLDRVKEWRREFDAFVRNGNVPQLEYIWLPNDHTYGSRAGKLTPVAYVATNDYAVGLMVDAISHSRIWRSSAIFITEDDAQDGPDHVSGQRTTLFVVSPYARGGVTHTQYSTVGVVRTMELLLGLRPLSNYDAMAVPLYGAFSTVARLQPYQAMPPRVGTTARSARTAYGAELSARLDFGRPDANAGRVLRDIIAHNR